MQSVQALHDAVAAVCPITGLAGPMPAGTTGSYPAIDGTLWRIDFTSAATSAQQTAGIAALLAVPNVAPPRTVSAKQIRYALNDLGVRAAWDTAVAASTPSAQDYWTSVDTMPEDNAKLVKWCAKAGITPAALFDVAVTM